MNLARVGTATLVNVAGIPLSLLSQVLLAQALGKAGYGAFSLGLVVASVASLVLVFGSHNALLALGGRALGSNDQPRFNNLVGACRAIVLLGWLPLLACSVMASSAFADDLTFPLVASCVVAGIWALIKIDVAALRLNRDLLAPLVMEVQVRELALVLVSLFALLVGATVSASGAMWAVAATLFSVGIYARFRLRYLGSPALIGRCTAQALKRAKSTVLPVSSRMAGISISQILMKRVDILAVGGFIGTEAVAEYVVIKKLADLCGLGLVAGNIIVGPEVARQLQADQRPQLQRLVTRVNRFAFGFALVAAASLAITGHWAIEQFFFEISSEAEWAFLILLGVQLVNSGFGNTTSIASIGGQERLAMRVMIIAAILNTCACIVLTPVLGITGVVVATAAIILGWNYWMQTICIHQVGIDPAVFPIRTATAQSK